MPDPDCFSELDLSSRLMPNLLMRQTLPILVTCAGFLHAAELPEFIVPGKEKEMELLETLFERHHSPQTICTLWDGWIPMSTLWPAVGEDRTRRV